MTPAEFLAAREMLPAGVTPETQEQAARQFRCEALAMCMSGKACAMRHRQAEAFAAKDAAARAKRNPKTYDGGRTYRGMGQAACAGCPLGAARLRLLDLPAMRRIPHAWDLTGVLSNPARHRINVDSYIQPEGEA